MQHSPAITLFQIMKIDTAKCGDHVNETGRGSIHLNTKSYTMIYCHCWLVLGNNQGIQLVQQAQETSRLRTDRKGSPAGLRLSGKYSYRSVFEVF